jgi:predicted secreted Zn-dependent protease
VLLLAKTARQFHIARMRFRFAPVAFAAVLLGCRAGLGQTVEWRTNFYNVTGTNFHEIRRSIAAARPWKQEFDAMTTWQVNWHFTLQSSDAGCRCAEFTTTTTIVITMPRWLVPTNATVETKKSWGSFYKRLLAHEAGHAELALAANSAVRRKLAQFTTGSDCASLKARMNEAATGIVAAHRKREEEFDRRTRHGTGPENL